ncbi:MAG: MATE family efflux transporter [Brevinema sp.]
MPTKKFLQEENILKMLLTLSLPAIFSGLVDSLYNTVDSIFVGYFVGNDGLAALAVINVIQLIFISIGVLFSVGNGSIISRALGANDHHRVLKTLIHSFWGNLFVSISLSFIFLINMDFFLPMIGASKTILPYAKEYGSIILWTAFILPLNNMMLGSLRAQGKVLDGTYLNIVAAGTNIILDALFIVVFHWGVGGAALATAISQALLTIALLYKIRKLYQTNLLFSHEYRFHVNALKEIIVVGFPTGMRLMLFVGVFSLANSVISSYGAEYLSAFGIYTRLCNLMAMILISLTMGGQPLIGINYGATLFQRVKKIILTIVSVGVGVGLLCTALLVWAPTALYQVFTPDPLIIQICQEISRYEGSTFWCWAVFICIVEALQAMGHARQSFFLSLGYPIFLIGMLNILPYYFNIIGVWLSFTVAYLFIGLVSVASLIFDFKNINKKIFQLRNNY